MHWDVVPGSGETYAVLIAYGNFLQDKDGRFFCLVPVNLLLKIRAPPPRLMSLVCYLCNRDDYHDLQ